MNIMFVRMIFDWALLIGGLVALYVFTGLLSVVVPVAVAYFIVVIMSDKEFKEKFITVEKDRVVVISEDEDG